jgi:tetratricopeptide (TPR) repeat protein
MSRSIHPFSIVLTVALLGPWVHALANEAAEVSRLHRAGQTITAMERAERFIATRPDDAPMRFVLGVMLADSQRNAEAIDVFLKLTLDHPQLAEPHNNLATLHAAAGEYDKARLALEQALRANPDYATAHENLGDVLAMLASQSYARAAKLDPGNAGLAPKMALVRELYTPRGGVAGAASRTTP